MNGHGDHWECIYESVEGFFENSVKRVFGQNVIPLPHHQHEPPARVDNIGEITATSAYAENKGALRHMFLTWKRPNDEPGILVSAFPWAHDGMGHEIDVSEVVDLGNYAEGIIVGSLPQGAALSLFDLLFYRNSGRYELGNRYQFSLAGIAYRIAKPEYSTIDVTRPDKEKISLEGMSAFLQIPEWGKSEYYFRGKIKEVNKFEFADRSIYKILLPLIRFDDIDFDIPVYASDLVVEEELTPNPGKDIEGELWLQGFLTDQLD